MNTTTIIILAVCTWYGADHQGKLMANGKPFDKTDFTCASYIYPLGTELTVRYGDKEVLVLVTDRCDALTEIDLSERAFEHICDLSTGRITVQVEFDIDKQTEEWRKEYGSL